MKTWSPATAVKSVLTSILCFSTLAVSVGAEAADSLEWKELKLTSIQVSVHRVTAANRAKLVKAFEQADPATRELINTPHGEIAAMPRLNANCSSEQLERNLAYGGLSTMRTDAVFYFKPARDLRCNSLNVREMTLRPIEVSPSRLTLDVSFDGVTRRASCDIIETDGPFGIWTNTKAGCALSNGEGTFTVEISD